MGRRGRWQVIGKDGDTPIALWREGRYRRRQPGATPEPLLAKQKARRERMLREDIKAENREVHLTLGVSVR